MDSRPLAFGRAARHPILLLPAGAAAELAVGRRSGHPSHARARPLGLARLGLRAATVTVAGPAGPWRIDVEGGALVDDLFLALPTAAVAGDALAGTFDQADALTDCATRHVRISSTFRAVDLPCGPVPVHMADGRRVWSPRRAGGRGASLLHVSAPVTRSSADQECEQGGQRREPDERTVHSLDARVDRVPRPASSTLRDRR